MPDIKIPPELKEYLANEMGELLGPIGQMIAPMIVSQKQDEHGNEVVVEGDVIEVTPVEVGTGAKRDTSDPRPYCEACKKHVASTRAYEKRNGDLVQVCGKCHADLTAVSEK